MGVRKTKDWIRGYLEYTKQLEAPEMFHLWTSVSLILTVLDRKVYFEQGFFTDYPNTFIILVGGSQEVSKSVAIGVGESILSELESQYTLEFQKITPEALITALEEKSIKENIEHGVNRASGLVVADELATYLDALSIKRGMIPILLKLHDARKPFVYRTESKGRQELQNPYVNMLAGAAPEYLRETIPRTESGGGLLARIIFVYQEIPRAPAPVLHYTEEQQKLKEDLVYDLERIGELEGPITFTECGLERWKEWYCDWREGTNRVNTEKGLRFYYAKKRNHIISVATAISVSEGDSLKITAKQFDRAEKYLVRTEKMMHHPLSIILASENGLKVKKVHDTIRVKTRKGIAATRKAIMYDLHLDLGYDELSEAIETLQLAGLIERKEGKGFIYYVPTEGGG